MPPDFTPSEPYIQIRFTGSELSFPIFSDVQNFLYDLNFLYEVTRLAIDPHYAEFEFAPSVYFRDGRPLAPEHRLHIERLALQSPIDINLVINIGGTAVGGAAVGAVTIVSVLKYSDKIIELINAPLKRRKLKAEVEKLERENEEAAQRVNARLTEDMSRMKQAEPYVNVAVRRLQRSVVRIEEVDIEVIRENR